MDLVSNPPNQGQASSPSRSNGAAGRGFRSRSGQRGGAKGPKPPMEVVKTWAFDSVGTRKYALQIRKAGNGNPCLKVVEGVPQPDGTFRKFDLTFWSEDWPRLFEMLDTARAFIAENNIRTPDGPKYEPGKRSRSGGKNRQA